MATIDIRPSTASDAAAVVALNTESVWALSPMDEADFARHRALASHLLVADIAGEVAGFAIAYRPGTAYDSINYRWHSERFDDFLYLDRIAVGSQFRRRGVAQALYNRIEADAADHGRMVLEVMIEPPNDPSLAFHRKRGYVEVGRLTQPDSDVCTMMAKDLGPADPPDPPGPSGGSGTTTQQASS